MASDDCGPVDLSCYPLLSTAIAWLANDLKANDFSSAWSCAGFSGSGGGQQPCPLDVLRAPVNLVTTTLLRPQALCSAIPGTLASGQSVGRAIGGISSKGLSGWDRRSNEGRKTRSGPGARVRFHR